MFTIKTVLGNWIQFYNIVHSLSVCMRANIIDLFCGNTTFIAFEKAFDLQARKLIIHDCNYKI